MASPVKIRSVPTTQDPGVNGILSDLKIAVESLYSAIPNPQPPTNLTATPIAGGVVLQFTRSNGVNFRVYYGSSSDRSKASFSDLGSNNSFTDTVGSGGVLRYYWVEAHSPASSRPSPIAGPVSATTLALGTSATVAPPPTQSYRNTFDAVLHRTRPVTFADDFTTPTKEGSD